MKNSKWLMAFVSAVALMGGSFAVMAQEHAMHGDAGAGMAMPGHEAMTRGEIRKWDAAQGKVTIRHEEIKNLMMPPMTMVFLVANPAQMQGLKMGDQVVFDVVEQEGKLVIKQIRKP